ncbi:MAG TPA: winged helix-turn-helix domain-containing protein [bacterium]|nr:winged helix-turn-helix domain-containing protein [bacterium]
MDLSFLIPSKVRRTILQFWVENPDAQMGVRELAREVKIAPQQALRELCNLESLGLLFSSKRGNQRAYRLNERFPLLPPIRDLFARYREEQNRTYEVDRVYDMDEYVKKVRAIPVPAELIPGLTSKRKKPRSYDEEKILKKFGQL